MDVRLVPKMSVHRGLKKIFGQRDCAKSLTFWEVTRRRGVRGGWGYPGTESPRIALRDTSAGLGAAKGQEKGEDGERVSGGGTNRYG